MTSFMGPMAPPPAAPPQPQAMDFQTDPTNRQRFRQFLNNRMQPPMMQQPSMMQAPMMQPPAHMPAILPEVDIFAPQGYADGGIVGGLNSLSDMSGDMVQQLNQVVYGGDPSGGGGMMGGGMGGGPLAPSGPISSPSPTPPSNVSLSPVLQTQPNPIKSLIPGNPPRGEEGKPGTNYAGNLAQQNIFDFGATPIDGLDMGVQMPPGFTPLPPGELGFTEDFGPLQAYMGGSSTFDESTPYTFEDGGSVPPRRTDIRGQDHMLSYITPDEADILQALGGSGEAGPMGIPAYIPDDGNRGSGNDTSNAPSGPSGGSSGGNDGGSDADEEGDASQVGDMFDSYESDSDADEEGDAIKEQAVIDQIVSDNEERQRQVDQLVIDDARQDFINRRSPPPPQVQAEIDQLKSNPANLGAAGQLLAEIRGAPATDTGIASVNTGVAKGASPTNNLLGGNLLGDLDSYKGAMDRRAAERSMNPADFEAQYGVAPRGVTGNVLSETPSIGIMTPSDDLNTDNMNFVNTPPNDLVDIGAAGLGVDVPTSTTTPAQNTLGMEDEYLDEDIAAGFGQYVGGPGGGPGSSGLSTFASRQKRANDYAKEMGYDLTDQSTMKRGAERGFSGITDEQRADLEKRAAESIFGDSFLNNPRKINDILSNVDKNNNLTRATGIYTNPDGTVRGVTSLPDPDGLMQSGVNLLGGFIPDFIGETYTGTGANPFNRGEDPGGSGGDGPDQPVKAANDPCPAGYQMVNGACQISGDIIDLAEDGPGSGFVINPNTGLPTLFQPTTQATQVGPINPFVLQPYPRPPVGINPPGSAAASGIQALSPTGAALGRSI